MASYTIELRRVCDIYGRDEVEKWFKDYNIMLRAFPAFPARMGQKRQNGQKHSGVPFQAFPSKGKA